MNRVRLQPPRTSWVYLNRKLATRICIEHMDPPLAWSMIAQRTNQSHQRLPQPWSSFCHGPIKIPRQGSSMTCPLLETLPSYPQEFI